MNYRYGTLFASLLLSLLLLAPIESIEANQQNDLFVVVADFMATKHSPKNSSHTASFIQVLTNLDSNTMFAFIDAADPYNVVGPIKPNQEDFNIQVSRFIDQLNQNSNNNTDGLLLALRESHSILGSKNASASSGVFVITGESSREFAGLAAQTAPLTNRFKSKGWHIDGIALPDHNSESIYFLDQVTNRTGGELFKLTIPDGYEQLINRLINKNSSKTLRNIATNKLDPNESMTSAIHIPPGTKETTVVVLRESVLGQISLGNPSGYLISKRSNQTVILDSPHVLIWKLFEPDPGNWSFELNGFEGHVSTWESSTNKYSMKLLADKILPQNQAIALSVQILDGDTPTSINDVNLYARITTPSNSSIIYKLTKDYSIQINSPTYDVYSAVIPSLDEVGKHEIKLELEWNNHNYKLSTLSNVEVKPFPILIINREKDIVPQLGQRTKIGNLSIEISGSTFPVKPAQIEPLIASVNQSDIIIDIVPINRYPGDTASDYNIFATTENQDRFTLSFNLKGEYSGQNYIYTGNQITFSSIPKLTANDSLEKQTILQKQSTHNIPEVTTVSSNIYSENLNVVDTYNRNINLMVIYSLSTIALLILAFYLYWINQINPHGQIRGEKDNQSVDLSNIQRSFLSKLISKNVMTGRELNLPGLEQTNFHFSRKSVSIINKNKDKAIRVNNQPIFNRVNLHDKTWIGVNGKLYTYTFD